MRDLISHFEGHGRRGSAAASRPHSPKSDHTLFAERITVQLRRGFWNLRFDTELERTFLEFYRRTGRWSRLTLIFIALGTTFLASLIDTRLLGLPEAAVPMTRLMQYGLQIPAVAIVGMVVWWIPARRITDFLIIVAMTCSLIGVVVQRIVDCRLGFYLPLELSAAIIIGTLTLGRVRFWVLFPIGVPVLAAIALFEYLLVAPPATRPYHLFASTLLLLIGGTVGYVTEYFIRSMWLNGKLLRYMARYDGLTGIRNRPAVEEAIGQAQTRASRDGTGFAVALLDIDAFGAYNNQYGHPAGDQALRQVAAALRDCASGPSDICGRYGGEEFLLFWDAVDADTAHDLAERCLAAIRDLGIEPARVAAYPWLTASIGVCWVAPGQTGTSRDDVISQADARLLDAKAGGRNCACVGEFVAPPQPPLMDEPAE